MTDGSHLFCKHSAGNLFLKNIFFARVQCILSLRDTVLYSFSISVFKKWNPCGKFKLEHAALSTAVMEGKVCPQMLLPCIQKRKKTFLLFLAVNFPFNFFPLLSLYRTVADLFWIFFYSNFFRWKHVWQWSGKSTRYAISVAKLSAYCSCTVSS